MTISDNERPAAKPGSSVSALGWSGLEGACRQILALLFFFGTVRFLSPDDLGVFSLGVALMGIFAIVIDEPIAEALVQKDTITASDWDTGYTINLGIAVLCLVLACGVSPVLAKLLHQPLLMSVIPALAVSSVAGAVGNVHKSFLSRSMQFRTIAQTALIAQGFAGIVGLGAAAAGFGYWALVLNVLSAATVTSLIYRIMTPWKPRFRIDTETVKGRRSYVSYSIAIRSTYLLRDQSLFVVVATLGDLKAVGYLSLAMRLARALGQLFEDVTSRPLISLISRHQNNLAQFGDLLGTILCIIGLVAFPSFVGVAELGTPLISVLLGAQWAPAGQLLPWICAGLSSWLFLHMVAVALRARGLGRTAVCLTAPTVFVDVVIFASAALIGLDWALRLWAVRALLIVPILIRVLATRLGLSARALSEIWTAPLTASILMLLVLRWLDGNQQFGQGALGLPAMVTAGAAVYCVSLLALSSRTTRNKLLLGVNRQ